MGWQIFAAVILQCWKPLHHCIEVILNVELKQGYCEILSQYLLYLHLAAAVPLLKTCLNLTINPKQASCFLHILQVHQVDIF